MNLVVSGMLCTDFRQVVGKRCGKMKLAAKENVLRVSLLVMSICFGILSISLIALGIAHVDELKWPRRYTGLNFVELPTFVIILGCMSLILAIGGCICSKSYNRIFYRWFLVTLILVLILQVSVSVMAFKTRSSQLDQKVESTLVTNEVIFTENHYNCCGLYGDEAICIEKKIRLGCAEEIIDVVDQVFSRTGYAVAYIATFQVNVQ
nr:unnamed protein product [Callosobruchus chinensis]